MARALTVLSLLSLVLSGFATLTACSGSGHKDNNGLQPPQGDAPVAKSPAVPTRGEASVSPAAKNIILFVADGLRPGMVNATETPTFAKLRASGVSFANSHSLFPTFTTANASALATGHYLGDTADFSNTVYIGYRLFSGAYLGTKPLGTEVPFLENDETLTDVNMHVPGGNYLDEESLLSLARRSGYNTAAIGKIGPVLIQDVSEAKASAGKLSLPGTIIIDDATGKAGGVPLPVDLAARLLALQLGVVAPGRDNRAPSTANDNGYSGTLQTAGTLQANLVQQKFFVEAATQAVLPSFAASQKPFVLVFWSRDPDGTQHNQGDSLGKIVPGINGPTSKAGIRNADANLARLMAAVAADPHLASTTDIIVTSDHGFSTISHYELDAAGKNVSEAYAASYDYKDVHGRTLAEKGHLPGGFLAIDLAHGLDLPLFDPDQPQAAGYTVVDPSGLTPGSTVLPKFGNGMVGGTGRMDAPGDAQVIVAANGGSDLVYIPSGDKALLGRVVAFLAAQDYVSGLFADDSFGTIPGTLPLSAINLKGKALLPTPSLVVNFRTFSTDASNPFTTEVELADTSLQEGQGMHGSIGRGDTYNFMAAAGPDFKRRFVDAVPASNADLPQTMAHILGLQLPSIGSLHGRVLTEALVGGATTDYKAGVLSSAPAAGSGEVTVLNYQDAGGVRYFDAAGFPGRTVGLRP